MPKFLTIGYGDQAGYDRTAQSVKDAAHAQDEKLRAASAFIGIAGKPVQVRNPEAAGLKTRQGPYMSSALPVAGLAVIEAANLTEAVDKVTRPLRRRPWRGRSLAAGITTLIVAALGIRAARNGTFWHRNGAIWHKMSQFVSASKPR